MIVLTALDAEHAETQRSRRLNLLIFASLCALCVSAISALKAFAISARKLSRGSGIQEGVGQGILGPQHFVETEGFDTRKTASLVASRHYAKSLAFIVAY